MAGIESLSAGRVVARCPSDARHPRRPAALVRSAYTPCVSLLRGKSGVVILAVASVACLGGAYAVDRAFAGDLVQMPLTSNLLAGIALLPTEVLVASVVVGMIQRRQQRQRWAAVTDELKSAIGNRWHQLRSLLVARYGLDRLDDFFCKIRAADEVWAALQDQDEAASEDHRGTNLIDWVIPEGAADRLMEVHGLWMMMWGAGAEPTELSAESRLTNVLLPRLSPDDPLLMSAVRKMIDSIEDLTDIRRDLELYSDPFPDTPFIVNDWVGDDRIIAHGHPRSARESLQRLVSLVRAAETVVREGDRLAATLTGDPLERQRVPRQTTGAVGAVNAGVGRGVVSDAFDVKSAEGTVEGQFGDGLGGPSGGGGQRGNA